MKKIIFRKYNESDKNKIKSITEPCYYEIFDSFSKDTVKMVLNEDSVVGWIHLHLPESSLYSGFVFLYIAPEHRRKGLGTYAYRQAENQLKAVGCNWWSSYPESEAADQFAISVGFDYTNTNSYLVYDGRNISVCAEGIRICRVEDYPTAPDIWSREYAAMHIRIGLPYQKKELSDTERKAEYDDFCKNINNNFVIEVDNKIIGTGSLFNDNSGIGSLAIDSKYSGNGYGTKLAEFLTCECIKRGCLNPCLYCETGNDNAMHIYKKIGYVEQSRESVAVKGTGKETECLLYAVMQRYGFSNIRLLEQFHKDSSRLICKVLADDKILMIRGLPETTAKDTIEGNVSAHVYLGNHKHLAPRIICMPDGANYTKEAGYWFYVLEYIAGEHLEENEADEKELGRVLRELHTYSDYSYPSGLDEDKTVFYGWFTDKEFKKEFDAILDRLPDFNQLDRCFIHSDIGPHNSLRTANGDIVLLDLDDAGIGSRYLDLGWSFIMQFVKYNRTTGQMRYRMDLAEAFLSGYYEGDKIIRSEYDLLWQGAIFMHISYMQDYGTEAVEPLWEILKFGIKQKGKLWQLMEANHNAKLGTEPMPMNTG